SVSRPSSSSFGELTRPRLPCQDFKFGSQVKFQLAATELLTSSFHRANPVHPPASGTSGLRPKEEAPDLSSDSRKEGQQNLRNPGSLRLTRPGTLFLPMDHPLLQTQRSSCPGSHTLQTSGKINALNFYFFLSVFCMWVKSAATKMTVNFCFYS
ncbi:hypothetical protein ATANTOWER_009795, partial [Ataeniobius toweri]|nr:hypothetical protein [Ataeniobius toweri]